MQKVIEAAPNNEEWRSWLSSVVSTHNVVIEKNMNDDVLRAKCQEVGSLIKRSRTSIIEKYLSSIR